MSYLKTFGLRFRRWREIERLNFATIAQLTGIPVEALRAWETSSDTDRMLPSLDELLILCREFEVDLAYWLDGVEHFDKSQLRLPGLEEDSSENIVEKLNELEMKLAAIVPSKDELELLRRYRLSSDHQRRALFQMLER